jgi:hypothetical protein
MFFISLFGIELVKPLAKLFGSALQTIRAPTKSKGLGRRFWSSLGRTYPRFWA